MYAGWYDMQVPICVKVTNACKEQELSKISLHRLNQGMPRVRVKEVAARRRPPPSADAPPAQPMRDSLVCRLASASMLESSSLTAGAAASNLVAAAPKGRGGIENQAKEEANTTAAHGIRAGYRTGHPTPPCYCKRFFYISFTSMTFTSN